MQNIKFQSQMKEIQIRLVFENILYSKMTKSDMLHSKIEAIQRRQIINISELRIKSNYKII